MVDKDSVIQASVIFTILILVLGVVWVLLNYVHKVLGILLGLIGLWFLVYFPFTLDIQYKPFARAGIAFGILLIITGLVLLIL